MKVDCSNALQIQLLGEKVRKYVCINFMASATRASLKLDSVEHTCKMLSSATEATTQSSEGFQAKSDTLEV